MDAFGIIIIALIVIALLLLVAGILMLQRLLSGAARSGQDEQLRGAISAENSALRQEINTVVQNSVRSLGQGIIENQQQAGAFQKEQLEKMEDRIHKFSLENEQKLEQIRTVMERKLTYMQEDNSKQLSKIKEVVDEKLQKTIEEKMTNSFNMVNENLKKVYEGLGEMQNLAAGVGDLKKVLTNVKSRGVLGEYQLKAILEEILSPSQYVENAAVKKNSQERVEFAVKLPGQTGEVLLLPIDSKFPADTYSNLIEAMDTGDKAQIDIAVARLTETIKREARDIRDKYINPPQTTDFAIMFLPFEGLYAEVVNRGLVELLQREYKVNIAGPSTMAALLNSLQMGFKTLAIQKKSSEVWKTLGAVKTEFGKFSEVLENTQKRLDMANKELDKLVGVRTRQIRSKLSKVDALDDAEAQKLLEEEIEN